MPTPRQSTARGTRPLGTSRPAPPEVLMDEDVADPFLPRNVIDYGLKRRAVLQALRTGGGFLTDACDADPYLLRAAKFHGEPTTRPCPICDHELTDVHYTYGRVLGPASGSAQTIASLERLAHEAPHFRVYVVEVCRHCLWNHVTSTFVLGHGRVTDPATARVPEPRRAAETSLPSDEPSR